MTALSDGEVSAFSLMANVWYDIDLGNSPITPFLGAGVGMAKVDVEHRGAMTPAHKFPRL